MACSEPRSNLLNPLTPAPTARDAALPVVLVLDDDPFWRRLMARKLSPGAIVRPAASLAAAEGVLENVPVDGIILELALRQGSALSLLRRVRLSPRPLPALVVSASECVLAASAVSALGAFYASKREPRNQLAPRIDQLLARSSRADDPLGKQVAELAVQGKLTRAEGEALAVYLRTGNRATLGRELGIAETSVKSRVRAVCRKLGLAHLHEVYRLLFERTELRALRR
jgi:DNA-binding NarL/FixJ family response regulator